MVVHHLTAHLSFLPARLCIACSGSLFVSFPHPAANSRHPSWEGDYHLKFVFPPFPFRILIRHLPPHRFLCLLLRRPHRHTWPNLLQARPPLPPPPHTRSSVFLCRAMLLPLLPRPLFLLSLLLVFSFFLLLFGACLSTSTMSPKVLGLVLTRVFALLGIATLLLSTLALIGVYSGRLLVATPPLRNRCTSPNCTLAKSVVPSRLPSLSRPPSPATIPLVPSVKPQMLATPPLPSTITTSVARGAPSRMMFASKSVSALPSVGSVSPAHTHSPEGSSVEPGKLYLF